MLLCYYIDSSNDRVELSEAADEILKKKEEFTNLKK